MKFDLLVGAHRAGDPAEATLVLLAVSALSGLRGDGTPMDQTWPARCISIRTIAAEVGITRATATRGLDWMVHRGAITPVQDFDDKLSYEAVADAVEERWQVAWQRIRLVAAVRQLHLRPNALLLVGLVHGQRPPEGPYRLSRRHIAERLGMNLRQVDRAIAGAKSAGALRTWTHNDTLHLLPLVPKKPGTLSTTPVEGAAPLPVTWLGSGNRPGSKAAIRVARKRQSGGSETANAIRRSGSHPDLHPDAAAQRVDSTSATISEPQTPRPPSVRDVRQVVEPWVVALLDAGIERLVPDNDDHWGKVAGLLKRLPGYAEPDFGTDTRRRPAFYREQLQFAARLCRWAGSPEELARWLVRVAALRTVTSLASYLRVASAKGDPGTLLRSAERNATGRAAESRQDFSPDTEKALEGTHVTEVQQLVASGAEVLAATDPAQRAALLAELCELLARGHQTAARAVLLRLVGPEPTDAVLQTSVGDILSVSEARRLLVA